jgi:hypothetical protein
MASRRCWSPTGSTRKPVRSSPHPRYLLRGSSYPRRDQGRTKLPESELGGRPDRVTPAHGIGFDAVKQIVLARIERRPALQGWDLPPVFQHLRNLLEARMGAGACSRTGSAGP